MYQHRTQRVKSPFYTRWWFVGGFGLIVCGFLAVVGGWIYLDGKYGSRARQFDFTRLPEMESASIVYDRKEGILGRFFVQNRDTVSMDGLSPYLVKAVISAEDARFYDHHGVDPIGIARAMMKNWQAKRKAQGASTITQQLARNTYQMFEKSYDRKIMEIFLALEVEKKYPKEKILELYLNRVFFGAGFYGAESASRGYFGKPAKDLTLSEAATLAGLLKNPNGLSPWSNRAACIDSRNFVLGRMLELKSISQEEYQAAIDENLAVKNRRPIVAQGYAMEMVRQQVAGIVGSEAAVSEGYRIYTTIDPDLQKKSEEALRKQLIEVENRPGYDHQTYSKYVTILKGSKAKAGDESQNQREDPEYLQGSVVILENYTGAILAMVGGRDFAHSQFNRALLSPRPPGTAFTPLVYAAAFEKGSFPGTLVDDSVIDNRQVMIGGVTGILGEWGPERADNTYEGTIAAREALVKGKNAATVRLGMDTGVEPVISLARSAGIRSDLRKYPATFLGSSEVTLMDLTLAYTMFPGGGTRPSQPFLIERIESKDGRVIYEAKPDRVRVLRDSTAFEISSCLSEALEVGTGERAYSQLGLRKFPLSGKTGTAYNFTDTWFLGYSSAITCGVWVGFDKPRTPIYRGAFSNQVVLPVWVDIMNSTFQNYPAREIPQPRSVKKVEVCTKSGGIATVGCVERTTNSLSGEPIEKRCTHFEWCTAEQTPKFTCPIHGPGGAVAQNSPADPMADIKPSASAPRAQLAVDLSSFQVVQMRAPTVIGGDDPFETEKPTTVMAAVPVDSNVVRGPIAADPTLPVDPPKPTASGTNAAPVTDQVRRAEPAKALEQQPGTDNPLKLDAPPALDF